MKHQFCFTLLLSLIAACSPKVETPVEPIEVNITALCRPADMNAANLYLGPIEFLPGHLRVSVLERRARMDHLFIEFHGKAAQELQDVSALYVGNVMPLMIGETRLGSPLIPEMITTGELVIDGKLYTGEIRALGEALSQPCQEDDPE